MKIKYLFLFILGIISFPSIASDSLNVMFYNLFRFPYSPPQSRDFLLKEIIDETKPDLFMVCELIDEYGANRILMNSFTGLEDEYARSKFIPCVQAEGDPLHQMVFYNTKKLILIHEQAHPTTVRDINQYTFLLNSTDLPEDSVILEVFVAHLKSSDGVAHRATRLGMIDTFFNKINELPKDRMVILGGDFNFYRAHLETGYNKLIDTSNHIVMIDPVDQYGPWHDDTSFSIIHTQSTRTSSTGFGSGGAAGGLDDRFDFIMISENLKNNDHINYIPGTYKAFGNNGNCFDQRVDAPECNGIYAQELRMKLHDMSDHLPVVMRFQVDKLWNPVSIDEKDRDIPQITFVNGNIISNQLDLKIKQGYNQINELIIYNIMGQVIKKVKLDHDQPGISIDFSEWTSGMYILKYGNEVLEKFIKK